MTAPRAPRPARGRIVPTGRGLAFLVLAAALLVAGAAIDRVELTYLGVVLAGAVAVEVVVIAAARRPRAVDRALDSDIVAVGDAVRVASTARGGAGSLLSRVHELASDGLLRRGERSTQIRSTSCTLTPTRRGVHSIGPLRVEALSPLGLVRRRRDVGDAEQILAVPPVVPLLSLRARGVDAGEEARPIERRGQGADNLIPRPYVPGDSMRRVHWRASAHHGDLMVREEEREQSPIALVLLDLADDTWSDGPHFDLALSACVSVTQRLLSDGYTVDVAASDGSPLGHVDSRESFLELLVACATLDPRGQGARLSSPALDAGIIVAVGRAPAPAASPGPHVLLAADPDVDRAAARGWRIAGPRTDVAEWWAAALEGRSA